MLFMKLITHYTEILKLHGEIVVNTAIKTALGSLILPKSLSSTRLKLCTEESTNLCFYTR